MENFKKNIIGAFKYMPWSVKGMNLLFLLLFILGAYLTLFVNGFGFILSVIAIIVMAFSFTWYMSLYAHDTRNDIETEQGQFTLAERDKVYGDDEVANEAEMDAMWKGGTIKELTGYLLGYMKNPQPEIDALKRELEEKNVSEEDQKVLIQRLINKQKMYQIDPPKNKNNNVAVFGQPGAGKGVGIISTFVMQLPREKNHSAVIADSKGEAYARFAMFLRACGVKCRMIEFNPHIMMHSDSFNVMSGVYDEMKAIDIANTIMVNTSGGELPKDFWTKNEGSLLLAGILYSMQDPTGERKTIKDIYLQITENDTKNLQGMLKCSSSNGDIFANASESVAGDTQTGLGIRLALLGNKVIQKLISEDDVSFSDLGQEQMVYFVSMSDHSSTMTFIQALFFTLVIGVLTDFADYNTVEKKLPCRVTFLLDEFRNIGRIPDFERITATSRGRNIDFTIILQDLPQLMSMYPNLVWESVLNDFAYQILLSTNSPTTAKWFSDRAGTGTALEKSYSYSENPKSHKFDKRFDEYHVSVKPVKYTVAPLGRIYRMAPNEIMVVSSGHNAAFMYRMPYWEHPFVNALLQTNSAVHVPAWISKMLQKVASGDMDREELLEYEIEYDEWIELVKKDKADFAKAVERHDNVFNQWDGIETDNYSNSQWGEEDTDDYSQYERLGLNEMRQQRQMHV
ncbi:MAG: hypothetical protein E7231_01050 [Cellulosilyticum sp.]|nr:hypothetical protein [Cellulosilyticum sp.]